MCSLLVGGTDVSVLKDLVLVGCWFGIIADGVGELEVLGLKWFAGEGGDGSRVDADADVLAVEGGVRV